MTTTAPLSRWSVRILDWPRARAQAEVIRTQVFVVEQNVPAELEMDEHDAASDHALAYAAEDGLAIGTGRLLPDGHIGRMAVQAQWRGKGVGAVILGALIERARQRGLEHAVLNAQTHALGFYERKGFVAFGAEFMEAGIPHRAMRLRLSK